MKKLICTKRYLFPICYILVLLTIFLMTNSATADYWETDVPRLTPTFSNAVAVQDDKIYVIGGIDPNAHVPFGLNEVFDLSTHTWSMNTTSKLVVS